MKEALTLDRVLHLSTLAGVLVSGTYLFFQLEKTDALLAANQAHILSTLTQHVGKDAHEGQARKTVRMEGRITRNEDDIEELEADIKGIKR